MFLWFEELEKSRLRWQWFIEKAGATIHNENRHAFCLYYTYIVYTAICKSIWIFTIGKCYEYNITVIRNILKLYQLETRHDYRDYINKV